MQKSECRMQNEKSRQKERSRLGALWARLKGRQQRPCLDSSFCIPHSDFCIRFGRCRNVIPQGLQQQPRAAHIQVEGLSRRFALPGGGEVVAVDNLSFSVGGGEVYGL